MDKQNNTPASLAASGGKKRHGRLSKKGWIKLLMGQRMLLLAAMVLTALQCVLMLSLPRLMSVIVDEGILAGNLSMIGSRGGEMLLLCFFLALTGYGAHVLGEVGSLRFSLDLRKELYGKITDLSFLTFERLGSASFITRLTEDVQILSRFICALIQVMVEPLFMVLGGVFFIWRSSGQMAFLFLGFILLQLLIMWFFIRRTAPLFRKVRTLTDGINGLLQDVFSRLSLVKRLGTYGREENSFEGRNRELVSTGYSIQKLLAVFQPLVMLVVDLAVGSILLYAEVALRGPSLGHILQILSYVQQILLSIVISGRIFQMLAEAAPSIRRIEEVEGMEVCVGGEEEVSGCLESFEAKGLSFAYPETKLLINDISFTIHKGEFLVVTGPVGCAKTTLAALLIGLSEPLEGEVLRNQKNIKKYRQDDLRRRVALVEKHTAIFSGTLRDNLTFGREGITEEDMLLALEAAQCQSLLAQTEGGLDGKVALLSKYLSGGEAQRLSIARALSGRPEVLILDDATSSLDYGTEAKLLSSLREKYPDMALILFTQRAGTALIADTAAYMDQGRFLCYGPPQEVIRECEGFRRSLSSEGEVAK